MADFHGNIGIQGLVYLAQWLHEKDTLSSKCTLFWLESALTARNIINTNPYYLKRRREAGEDIEGTLEASRQIGYLRLKK